MGVGREEGLRREEGGSAIIVGAGRRDNLIESDVGNAHTHHLQLLIRWLGMWTSTSSFLVSQKHMTGCQ